MIQKAPTTSASKATNTTKVKINQEANTSRRATKPNKDLSLPSDYEVETKEVEARRLDNTAKDLRRHEEQDQRNHEAN